MSKKAIDRKPAQPFRYSREELKPRNPAADDGFIDAFIERNRAALNESIEDTERQFERGEVHTLEEVMSEIQARSARRRSRRKKI